jgi:cytochrome c oxidase cbb3-type subunit 1
VVRGLGGLLYLGGALIMVWNIWMTIRVGYHVTVPVNVNANATPAE